MIITEAADHAHTYYMQMQKCWPHNWSWPTMSSGSIYNELWLHHTRHQMWHICKCVECDINICNILRLQRACLQITCMQCKLKKSCNKPSSKITHDRRWLVAPTNKSWMWLQTWRNPPGQLHPSGEITHNSFSRAMLLVGFCGLKFCERHSEDSYLQKTFFVTTQNIGYGWVGGGMGGAVYWKTVLVLTVSEKDGCL